MASGAETTKSRITTTNVELKKNYSTASSFLKKKPNKSSSPKKDSPIVRQKIVPKINQTKVMLIDLKKNDDDKIPETLKASE